MKTIQIIASVIAGIVGTTGWILGNQTDLLFGILLLLYANLKGGNYENRKSKTQR